MNQEQHDALITSLWKTHKEAALRENSSKHILNVAWDSNGKDYKSSIIAAMCALGGKHAPIQMTYSFISDFVFLPNERKNSFIGMLLSDKDGALEGRIPGFGSSMVKGERDPLLNDIAKALHDISHEYEQLAEDISNRIYGAKGERLYPNLAFYTAASMIETKTPPSLCEYVMIGARIEAWTEYLFQKYGKSSVSISG